MKYQIKCLVKYKSISPPTPYSFIISTIFKIYKESHLLNWEYQNSYVVATVTLLPTTVMLIIAKKFGSTENRTHF